MTPRQPPLQRPFRTLAQGRHSAVDRPGLLVARTGAEWERLWSALDPRRDAPRVDWPGELAIVVALGARRTGGYGVHVERLAEDHATLTVHARETRPGGGIASQARTHPFIATAAYPGTIEHELTVAPND